MLKRFILIILSAILMVGTIPFQSHATAGISSEGRICRELGMLKGDTGVVDERYLNTRPTRFQAAIMYLRLKGLEEDALSYDGDKNFDDARLIAWKEGRNLLSYLKRHPELGWVGDGYNFRPNNLITAKEYYKVLLEALGYKQTLDGAGDFTWDKVLQFAESKGLSKVANVSDFTVDSLAAATVEALKSRLKDSESKLIDYLIKKGLVDKRTAESLDLYREQIDVEIDYVTAISNSRIEIVFEKAVYDFDMDYRNDFSVSRGNTKVDIKDIYQKNDYSVILEVSPLSANTEYIASACGRKFNITALAKDTATPGVIGVAGKDTDLLEITYDSIMDAKSVQDMNNYSIKDVSIKSARLDKTNTKVLLTTQGLQYGHSYDLKIKNVKNADGVIARSITKRFSAKRDNTAPAIQTITVLNNTRLEIRFKDASGLDKESAEDRSNYSISSAKGNIDVNSVTVTDKDNDAMYDTVTLVTDTQTAGAQYTLHITDITDNSVMKNKITRDIRKDFRGKSKDGNAPKIVGNPYVITDNKLQIVFSDANALDPDTVRDLGNYEVSGDLDIIRAEIKDPSEPYSDAGRTVILTTSEMEKSKQYTIEVSGIADEFGNYLDSSKKCYFRGRQADKTPPYILAVNTNDDDEIVLSFDDCIDKRSAEDTRNYKLDGLYLVTRAHLDSNEKTVTLTTSRLSSSSKHKLLLNGIKDLAGNYMKNVTVNVAVFSSYNNSEPAEVAYIEAVYKNEIQVHFEDRIKAKHAVLVASGVTFEQRGEVIDEGTTIIMQAMTNMQDKEYYVSGLSYVTSYNNKSYVLEDGLSFYGTTETNNRPEVEDWEQVNVRTFRVIFSEPVLLDGNLDSAIKNPSGVGIEWTAKVNPDDEEIDDAFNTIDFIALSTIPADKEFNFNFSDLVTDYVGTHALDEEDTSANDSKATILESYIEDEDKPFVEAVEAVTSRRVEITFNEEMLEYGRYQITYTNDKDKLSYIPIQSTGINSENKEVVTLLLGSDLSSDYYYTLEVLTSPKDLAGNRLDPYDTEYEFDGVDIMDSDYIQGVDVNSATSFVVTKSNSIGTISSVAELGGDGNILDSRLMDGNPERISSDEFEVNVKRPLLKAVSYKVTVDGLQYTFKGIIEDSDITFDNQTREIRFYGSDTHSQEVIVKRMDGTGLDVYENNNRFYIRNDEQIEKGDTLYFWVKDTGDNEILYGARIVIQNATVELSSQKNITEFAILGIEPDVFADINGNTVTLTVPYGTNTATLKPEITISPRASVSPSESAVLAGSYIVTAENGTTKTYNIVVKTVESKLEKRILSFDFNDLNPDVKGAVDEDNKKINLTVPYGTKLTELIPTIRTSPDTTVSPASLEAGDFSKASDFSDVKKPVIYTVIAADKSTQKYEVYVNTIKASSEKQIKSFKLAGFDGEINQQVNSILIKVPFGTKLSQMETEIGVSDHAAVDPASGAKLDFTDKEKVFTVTAQDGTTADYTVSVIKGKSSLKAIEYFAFEGLNPKVEGKINQENKTITLTVPSGTSIDNLIPTIRASENAAVESDSVNPNNFTGQQVYTVTAEDGTKEHYVVEVIVQKSSEKQIKEFSIKFPYAMGIIDEVGKTIVVGLPNGTAVANLAAGFKCSDFAKVTVKDTLQESGVSANNFTSPVVYRVTAQDGSFEDYTVSVAIATRDEKRLTSFTCSSLSSKVNVIINESASTITINLAQNIDIKQLAMTFTYLGSSVKVGEVEQISGVTRNDFSQNLVYTVTAADGSAKAYTVIVKQIAP